MNLYTQVVSPIACLFKFQLFFAKTPHQKPYQVPHFTSHRFAEAKSLQGPKPPVLPWPCQSSAPSHGFHFQAAAPAPLRHPIPPPGLLRPCAASLGQPMDGIRSAPGGNIETHVENTGPRHGNIAYHSMFQTTQRWKHATNINEPCGFGSCKSRSRELFLGR